MWVSGEKSFCSGLCNFLQPGCRACRAVLVLTEESLLPKPCLLGHPSRRKNASPYVFSRRQAGLTDSNEMMYSKKCSIHGTIMTGGEGGVEQNCRDGCQGRTRDLPSPTAGQPQVRLGTSTGSEKIKIWGGRRWTLLQRKLKKIQMCENWECFFFISS